MFGTIGFAVKSGLALGSPSFLLLMKCFFQYAAKLPDAPEAIRGFRVCSGIVAGILFTVCTVLLVIYQLNKRVTIQMRDELPAGRQRAVTA